MKGSELDIDSFGTKYRYFDIITIRAFGFYLKEAGFAIEKIHKKTGPKTVFLGKKCRFRRKKIRFWQRIVR